MWHGYVNINIFNDHSESIRFIPKSVSASIRKKFSISFDVIRLKINMSRCESIRDFESEWIRTNRTQKLATEGNLEVIQHHFNENPNDSVKQMHLFDLYWRPKISDVYANLLKTQFFTWALQEIWYTRVIRLSYLKSAKWGMK